MTTRRGILTPVRGVMYQSTAEAARQIGVSYSTLRDAIDRGAQDACGLQCLAGHLDGVPYPSKAAAARALGISPQLLHLRISKGIYLWT